MTIAQNVVSAIDACVVDAPTSLVMYSVAQLPFVVSTDAVEQGEGGEDPEPRWQRCALASGLAVGRGRNEERQAQAHGDQDGDQHGDNDR